MPRVILLLDDSRIEAGFIERALNKTGADIELVWETEPDKALARLQGDPPPDLMLLDLRMPNMSGIDFLEMISEKGLRRVPVVVLTNSSDEDEIRQAIAAGAVAFFTKPDSLSGYQQLASRLVETFLPRDRAKT